MAIRSPASFSGPLSNVSLSNSTATTNGRLDNSTLIATDAFVNQQISSSIATIPVTTTGGLYNQGSLGSGLSVTVHTTAGVVDNINAVPAGGSSYAVGDVVVLNAGNSDAILLITAVTGGVVSMGGVAIVYGGTGYTNGQQAAAVPVPPGQRSIVLSGTLTSNVTLVVQNGTYLNASRRIEVANNTTGAFTTTVKLSNGAGGTIGNGVVIPQGTNNSTSVQLYTDGQNDIWLASSLTGLGATGMATQPNGIRAVTTSQTVTSTDFTVLGDATAGAITITLQAAASNAKRLMAFNKKDATANTVTIKGNASELIGGSNTNVLSAQFSAILIQCDGTQWWVI